MSTAWAQPAAAASSNMSMLMSYLPIVLIIGIFYMLVMRPQANAAKQRAEMLKALAKGNTVVLQAGMVGTIKQVHEKSGMLEVELLPAGTPLLVERTSVDRLVTDTSSLPGAKTAAPEETASFKKKR